MSEATESITVAGLLKALHERRARLPAEIGAFIALRCLEIGLHNPTELEAERITLTSAGEVVLDQDAEAVDEQSVARSVVSLLGRLLVAAGSGIPPMMLSLVERGRQQQDDSVLDLLRDELEASLVPLNRSASERVLARLVRDSIRGVLSPTIANSAPQDPDALDQGVDALLEGREVPDIQPSLSASNDLDIAAVTGRTRPEQATPNQKNTDVARDESSEDASSARRVLGGARDLSQLDESPSRVGQRSRLIPAIMIGAALLGAYAVGWLGGDSDTGVTSSGTEQGASALARRGALTVQARPDRAQVFLFVGRGEASVRDLDITLDHEFAVVTAGQGASRQVLPRCASNGPCTHWMEGSSGWEAELRVDGDGDSPNRGAEALGDTRLVGDLGQGGGALGTVRVTGSSPEAMIYRFVGHTPNLSVNELAVDSVHRLLLVAPRHRPEFVEVEPTAWRAIAGAWTANVEVALDPQN